MRNHLCYSVSWGERQHLIFNLSWINCHHYFWVGPTVLSYTWFDDKSLNSNQESEQVQVTEQIVSCTWDRSNGVTVCVSCDHMCSRHCTLYRKKYKKDGRKSVCVCVYSWHDNSSFKICFTAPTFTVIVCKTTFATFAHLSSVVERQKVGIFCFEILWRVGKLHIYLLV